MVISNIRRKIATDGLKNMKTIETSKDKYKLLFKLMFLKIYATKPQTCVQFFVFATLIIAIFRNSKFGKIPD